MSMRYVTCLIVSCFLCLSACGGGEKADLPPRVQMQVKRVMVVEVNTAFNEIWTRAHRADTTGVADLAVRLSLASRQISALLASVDLPEKSRKALLERYAEMAAAAEKLGVEATAGDIPAVVERIKVMRADHCNGCHLAYGYRKI